VRKLTLIFDTFALPVQNIVDSAINGYFYIRLSKPCEFDLMVLASTRRQRLLSVGSLLYLIFPSFFFLVLLFLSLEEFLLFLF